MATSRTKLYADVDTGFHCDSVRVTMGEVIVVNPNSRKSIAQVLQDLQQQTKVGQERKWVRIGFDDVPYHISASLIRNYVACTKCGEELDLSKMKFDNHLRLKHSRQSNVSYNHVLNNILLVPGLGHMAIDLIRALMPFYKMFFINHASKWDLSQPKPKTTSVMD